jgi:hypothetical protein
MSPWTLQWWEWFLLAFALYFVHRIVYSDQPMAVTIRFCLIVGICLSILMGVIRLVRLA